MNTNLFHQMFGPLNNTAMDQSQLELVQKYHPQTFKGYPSWMLHEISTNPKLNRPNQIGYEGMFDRAASIFSPEDPMAFGTYITQNIGKMDPYGIKKLFDYIQFLDNADQMNSRIPRDKTE